MKKFPFWEIIKLQFFEKGNSVTVILFSNISKNQKLEIGKITKKMSVSSFASLRSFLASLRPLCVSASIPQKKSGPKRFQP